MKTLVDFIYESSEKYKPSSISALKRNNKELYKIVTNDKVLSEIAKIKRIKFYQNPDDKYNKNVVQIEIFEEPNKNKEIIEQIKKITGKYVNFATNPEYYNDGYNLKKYGMFGFYNIDNGKIYDEFDDAKEGK